MSYISETKHFRLCEKVTRTVILIGIIRYWKLVAGKLLLRELSGSIEQGEAKEISNFAVKL